MRVEGVNRIAVLGGGLMGHGIAQVCAMAGYEIKLYDINNKILDNALLRIEKSLKKFAEKGKISESEMDEILKRIHTTTDLREVVMDADLVIEAIPENLELKMSVFSEIDKIAKSDAIFASNTSSLSITELASSTTREERFVGMHWFNPPQVMKLIEIVRGERTSDSTIEVMKKLVKSLGKEYVVVKDTPGFIVNRILVPMINEAIKILESGIASAEDIDKAMVLGANMPMGPLRLADFVGLDTLLKVLDTFRDELGDCYKASTMLKRMVYAGKSGIKSGEGFYIYR